MTRVSVLDPTAPPPELSLDPGPAAGPLKNKRVGIRIDQTWQSWLQVADEWQRSLRAAGAEIVWFDAGNRIGDEGDRTRRELDTFAEEVDVAIVGLGN